MKFCVCTMYRAIMIYTYVQMSNVWCSKIIFNGISYLKGGIGGNFKKS